MTKEQQEAYLKGLREGIDQALAALKGGVRQEISSTEAPLRVRKKPSQIRNVDAKHRIVDLLAKQGSLSVAEIKTQTGVSHTLFWKAFNRLQHNGVLVRQGRGVRNNPFVYKLSSQEGIR